MPGASSEGSRVKWQLARVKDILRWSNDVDCSKIFLFNRRTIEQAKNLQHRVLRMKHWENRLPDPEFERLSIEKSRAIDPLRQIVVEPSRRHAEIVHSASGIAGGILAFLQSAFVYVSILCMLIWFIAGILLAIGIIVAYLLITGAASFWKDQKVKKVLLLNAEELGRLEQFARDADARIRIVAAEYDECIRQHCDTFPSYPADWDERRRFVLQRDNHTCTSCGYPHGFRRLVRELHIHHKVSLSDGGNNEPSNLTTLCHVCHRKVDGKHATVRKLNHGRRRRW